MLTAIRAALIIVMAAAALLALHLTAVAMREPVAPQVRWGALLTWWGIAVGVIWLCVRAESLVRQRMEARRHQRLAAAEAATHFTADARWVGMALIFLLVLAVMVLSLWIALRAHRTDMLIAVVCTLPLLPLALMYARMVLRPGPLLSMNQRGIDHASIGFIPWSSVIGLQHDTTTIRRREHHLLALGVRDPWRYLDQCNGMVQWSKQAYRRARPRYGSFEISLERLDRTPEEIVTAAQQLRAKAGGDFLADWSRHLDDASVRNAFDRRQLLAEIEALPADADEARIHALGKRTQEVMDANLASLQTSTKRARRANYWMLAWLAVLVLLFAWRLWSTLH